jgi:hypothetical protein
MLWLSMVLFVFWQCLCHPFCLDRKCVVMAMKFVETDKVDLMVGGIEWETKLIVKRTASDLKQHFFGWCLVLCLSVCPFLLMWFTFISFSFIYFYFKWCCSQLSIESDRLSLLLHHYWTVHLLLVIPSMFFYGTSFSVGLLWICGTGWCSNKM